jgi:hypothetical protein
LRGEAVTAPEEPAIAAAAAAAARRREVRGRVLSGLGFGVGIVVGMLRVRVLVAFSPLSLPHAGLDLKD